MTERYEIIVAGKLSNAWAEWLACVDVVYMEEKQQTRMSIDVVDQAALHGILNKIRDLGLHLVLLRQE